MNLDSRLREHFATASEHLPDPPGEVDAVVTRGRRRRRLVQGVVLMVAAVAVIAVPVMVSTLPTTVELVPAGPPGESEEPAGEPSGVVTRIRVGDLGAAVLAYGPYEHDLLHLRDGERDEVVSGTPVDVALPDGQGGWVVQSAVGQGIGWNPAAGAAGWSVEEDMDGSGESRLHLRAVLPDNRVVYSTRPAQERMTEASTEDFFAIALAEGAEPEHLGSRRAFDSWHVGPAVAAAGPVHASCHLHCSIRPGLVDDRDGTETIYDGAAIEGLTATPDGRVVAFVEFQTHEEPAPELVLLDGATFEELARVPIALDPGDHPGSPVVSLSADGQRVLVTIGAAGTQLVPKTPYLVEGALTGAPEVMRVDAEEVLRWVDPFAAAAADGSVAGSTQPAVGLVEFARSPGPETFAAVPFAAEVALGLGPDLVGDLRPAEGLVHTEAWLIDHPDGFFRAAVGPWSALDRLARAGDVVVGEGIHGHCASPPMPVPAEVAGLRQLHIQPSPDSFDSCLLWWVVDLFLDADGRIVAVTLDFFEP